METERSSSLLFCSPFFELLFCNRFFGAHTRQAVTLSGLFYFLTFLGLEVGDSVCVGYRAFDLQREIYQIIDIITNASPSAILSE